MICFYATQLIKRRLFIDDSLDVFPVHGVGGILGTLLAGVFVSAGLGGAGFAEGVTMAGQVMTQLIGILATIVWCGVLSWVLLKGIGLMVDLRVTEEQETEGLDVVLHDESGYNL